MSRQKGSKNKPKLDAGNSAFNIANVVPSQTLGSQVAPGAVLPEDFELDRTLQAMTSQMPEISDVDPTFGVIKREVDKREMLGDAVEDYTPASTYEELQEQARLAVIEGCDSIEATLECAKKICRDPSLEKVGYFMFHGVKVYLVGAFERAKKRDSLTIEQKTFGKSDEIARQEALKKQIKALEEQLREH